MDHFRYQELGFVLRRFLPQKNKISLLTQSLGKVDVVPVPTLFGQRLWPAMLISFQPTFVERYSLYRAERVEIVSSLFIEVRRDIEWVHHLLELCYFFLPAGMPNEEFFGYLCRTLALVSFHQFLGEQLDLFKKVCLVRFFALLGFGTVFGLDKKLSVIEKPIFLSVDFPDRKAIEFLPALLRDIQSNEEKLMDRWIKGCLKQHPGLESFKTINISFLNSGK